MTIRFKRSKLIALALMCSAGYSSQGVAESLGSLDALTQERFVELAENLGAATHYKALGPAEPLGVLGFDVGIELSSTEIDDDIFDDASDGDFELSELIIPRVHINKGLPFGFDIGASLSAVPDTDITILGGELRYAFVTGGALSPAIAVRGTYTRLEGLSDFDLDNAALEVTASKGFLVLTPYVGAGIVRTNVEPGSTLPNLSDESFEQNKVFAGLTISLGFALTLEVDRTGDYRTYSAKAGIRF